MNARLALRRKEQKARRRQKGMPAQRLRWRRVRLQGATGDRCYCGRVHNGLRFTLDGPLHCLRCYQAAYNAGAVPEPFHAAALRSLEHR